MSDVVTKVEAADQTNISSEIVKVVWSCILFVYIICYILLGITDMCSLHTFAEDPVGVSKQTVPAALDIKTRSSPERQMHSSRPREKNSRGND